MAAVQAILSSIAATGISVIMVEEDERLIGGGMVGDRIVREDNIGLCCCGCSVGTSRPLA